MTEPSPSQIESQSAEVGKGAHGSTVFYRYRTADGRTAVVDSLSQVPARERDRAERIELEPARSDTVSAIAKQLDWASFAAGFGLALAFAVVVLAVSRSSLRWLGILMMLGLMIGGSGAYFGWLRRSTGQGTAAFASPSALIDDAQRAVEKMKSHDREQDRAIQEIQREAK